MKHIFQVERSSMIQCLEYDDIFSELTVFFADDYYIKKPEKHKLTLEQFSELITSKSVGKYYLENFKKQITMSGETKKERIGKNQSSTKTRYIELDVCVDEIIKDWLFHGKTGKRYLKLVFALKPDGEVDKYQNCGMITQKVPKEVYQVDKEKKGPILGNGFEPDWDAMRGSSGANEAASATYVKPEDLTEPLDDLPF